MAENSLTMDNMKNICNIVEEREKTIKQTDIKIEHYKNALDKVLDEIRNLEKEEKRIEEEENFIQKQIEQLEFLETSIEASQEVARQSLINHQYFEQIVDRELKTKDKETEQLEHKCINLYADAIEKLNQNPLYRESEQHKVEFLKLDFERRNFIVKIRERKIINVQKKEIEKKIFYNFFIKLAEGYLCQERTKELEKLKIEELEAVKWLFTVQEEVKLKQKLGAPRDKIKRIVNITFGSQESRTDNLQNKVVPPQQKKEQSLFNKKLNTMFIQDEAKHVLPPKINILKQKVIMPTLVTPNFTLPEKRKNKTIDLSRKFQKLVNNSRGATGVFFSSQSSENRLSQSSQQSQPSQPEHLPTETLAANNQESSIKNADIRKQLSQQQDRQGISIEIKENVPTHYQMVESIGAEKFKMDYPQVPQSALLKGETKQVGTSSTPDMLYTGPTASAPKCEIIPKTAVSEQSKCVRFNLEPTNQTETKTMFGAQSMFANIFNPFGSRATHQNEVLVQQQATGVNNTTFNMSLTDPAGENSHVGLDFDQGERRSLEYSDEVEEDEQQTFKTPEMPSFEGGFFSFGKNMFTPF